MKTLYLLQAGLGNVGKALLAQIIAQRNTLQELCGVELVHCGLFTSNHGVFNPAGLSKTEIEDFPNGYKASLEKAIELAPHPFVLIDVTTSDKMQTYLLDALKKGGSVVLANKRPLASDLNNFHKLHSVGAGRILYETTVGAGLPVIRTLKTLLATGDEVVEINGCLSGTLGYICSELGKGTSFSDSVAKAKELGFTESDPREDLSGADVARKAIILARMMGLKLEMKDVKVQPLYPKTLAKLSVAEFMKQSNALDKEYKERFMLATKKDATLRFVAHVSKKGCSVRLIEVPRKSSLGSLQGPDNLVEFTTKRYLKRPLVIKGPGAGPEVTAGGVFGDILQIAGIA